MPQVTGGRLIWITGISGAGKTTIGKALYERLKPGMPALVYLDGDEVRQCFGDDLGFTLEARDANAFRFTRLCRLLCAQGLSVVCAANLTSQRFRDWCRAEIPGYFEVFLDVPMDVLIQRDPKGLYARALAGEANNVVGIDNVHDLQESVWAQDGGDESQDHERRREQVGNETLFHRL